ncbi:SAM-dependent methyltransferase [Agrobacterium vitis]|nr:SAM-dependent methyltransferase [Agrobacterium vitis]MBE1438453.1 SAM-dependent methyltransferase [Agrobacterium vitis]
MNNKTLEFYATNAATYVSHGTVNPRLNSFLDRLPPGGTILELGTGSGVDAKAMLNAGFRVDATDGSSELAQEAEKLLGQPVRQMLFNQLDAVQAYDGVYANASLLHAARTDLPDIISRIHRSLKMGGYVWASFKGGQQEGLDGLGRYYNYLSASELKQLWSHNGQWSTLEHESWLGSGYDKLPTEWHYIIAKRQ